MIKLKMGENRLLKSSGYCVEVTGYYGDMDHDLSESFHFDNEKDARWFVEVILIIIEHQRNLPSLHAALKQVQLEYETGWFDIDLFMLENFGRDEDGYGPRLDSVYVYFVPVDVYCAVMDIGVEDADTI